jgi:hypothetical protein
MLYLFDFILKNNYGTIECLDNLIENNTLDSIFNPSICYLNNDKYVTLRRCNYYQDKNGIVLMGDRFLSTFYLFKNNELLLEITPQNLEPNGIEDARLFTYNNELYISCSKIKTNNPLTIGLFVYKINLEKQSLEYIFDYGDMEKNWLHIPNSMKFLRWVGSELYDNGNIITYGKYNGLRGSTKLVPYKEGFLCICHTSTQAYIYQYEKVGLCYYHYFVYLDKDFNIIKFLPFRLTKDINIEFITGLDIFNDKLHISGSLMDKNNFIIEFDMNIFQSLI